MITMRETASAVKVKLYYGVFEKENVITRTVCIENQGKEAVILDKALSCNVDFLFGNWDLIYFEGRHAMERIPERVPVLACKGGDRKYSRHVQPSVQSGNDIM